jgi:hypothetical protein
MANRRFIDFPIATTVGDSDIILIWQSGVNKQTTKATFLSGLPENLDELNDVAISGLTNGQILRYDSVTGKWENTDQGNLDLNDLNDVSIVSPSNGQVLVYNSSTSKWENSSGGFVPYTGAVTTVNLGAQTIQAGSFVKAGGTSAQFLKANGSVDSTAYGTGSVTSVALTMPTAFTVGGSPITSAGTLAVTGAGTVGQYIRGDGSLADFPESSGGGSSVSYYLNGSVNQGTIGGVAYKELNKVPILGAGTDFTINANGYIASFLTDAGDPNLLEIPGGNWNFETYFSASSGGGSPTFYVELYKYNGTTFTLLASNSTFPELIAFGTNVTAYFSTLAVPTTTLALTDRLAIRYYVTHSGRTITMHTEDNHLCQIITTFTTGLTALNGLTAQVQNFAVGTSGTDFNIASATATHTFNLPTASATNRGALSSADWTTFNAKQNALTLTTTGSSGAATLVGSTLNIPIYSPDLSGYVPTSRTITINGTTQDLSANRTFNVGTVTSVGLSSATSGVTIGSTPVTTSGTITLAIATASGSQNGLLSSTDWTTFNGKQNALTNPVTGTGTTNYLPKFTGASTIGNSIVQDTGTRIDIAGVLRLTPSSQVDIQAYTGSAYSNLFYDAASHNWQTGGGTAKMNLTSVGNLGLGVTPSAGGLSGYALFQIAAHGTSIYSGTNQTLIGTNILWSGGSASYSASTFSTLYNQQSGQHQWFNAPSGTAGNAISFTQAMTLTSGGNLLVGTTTDNGAKLQVDGVVRTTNKFVSTLGNNQIVFESLSATTGFQYLQLLNNTAHTIFGIEGTAAGSLLTGGTANASVFTTVGNTNLEFGTNQVKRLTIAASTGAATFSSSVTAGAGINATGYTTSSGANYLEMGTSSTSYSINAINRSSGNYNFPLFIDGQKIILNNGSTGNVLIGTTTDNGARLQVSGAIYSSDELYLDNGKYLRFKRSSSGLSIQTLGIPSGTDDVRLLTTGDFNVLNGSLTNLMTVKNGGNVGIGTTSPSSKLNVVGAATEGQGLLNISNTHSSGGLYFPAAKFKNTNGNHSYGIVAEFSNGVTGASDRPSILFYSDAVASSWTVGQVTSAWGVSDSFGIGYRASNSPSSFTGWPTNYFGITTGGNVLVGSTSDNGSKLQVNGAIRTAQPVGTTSNGWLLGRALVSGTSTPNRWIRVQIGLEYYDILAVYMGTL